MNPFDLFGGVGHAITIIYKLGFIPKEDDFVEFSKEDYANYEQEVGAVEGKMFTFKDELTDTEEGAFAFREKEKQYFLDARQLLYCLCEGKEFSSDTELLEIAAKILPPAFSKGFRLFRKRHQEHR